MNNVKLFISTNSVLLVFTALSSMQNHHHFHFSSLPSFSSNSTEIRPISKMNTAVLFCEIKNARDLYLNNDLKTYATFLKNYFNEASTYIRMSGGQINKYMEGSFLAVFPGDDMSQTNSCNSALTAAFSLINLEEKLEELGVVNIQLAIGLNYGLAAKGIIGNSQFYEETYIGDTINIASRLQDMCYKLNQNIVISQFFFHELNADYKRIFSLPIIQTLKGRMRKTIMYAYNCIKDFANTNQDAAQNNKIYLEKFPSSLTSTDCNEIEQLSPQKYVIMCCDIRNFTTYSERDQFDPGAILNFLSTYHAELAQISSDSGGFPHKFLGDGILIIFPISNRLNTSKICDNAIKCGLRLMEVASKYGVENGIGIDLVEDCLITVGIRPDAEQNNLINCIFLGNGVKKVSKLEAINKNPYIHSVLAKHLLISDPFYINMSEQFKNCFNSVNTYLSSKRKNKIWGYLYDTPNKLPLINRRSRKSKNKITRVKQKQLLKISEQQSICQNTNTCYQ